MNPGPEGKKRWLVFLFSLSVYLLTGQGSIQSADGKIMYLLTQIPSVMVNISRYYYDLRQQYQEQAHDMLLYSPAHSPLIGQLKQVVKVFNQLQDKEFMAQLVDHALAGKKFLGTSDIEVLEKGLAVNAPNFWWYFMSLFGYSAGLTFFPAIVLLALSLLCGYKLFKTQEYRI